MTRGLLLIGMFTSFGQLLRDANAGALYKHACEIQCHEAGEGFDMDQFQGYDAEEDSSGESDDDGSGGDIDSDVQEDKSQEHDDARVQFVDDSIAEEAFQERVCVDSDYDQAPRGIDDTVFFK